jgi:hypothetical protein
MWRYKDGNMVNEKGKVMDVHKAMDTENRQVIAWNKHNGINQQWDILYVDEQKPEPTKGQMSPKWGFIVERPFYIVSEMKSNRVITSLKSLKYAIIKTPNGNNSQQFYFHQGTRTIKLMRKPADTLVEMNNYWLGDKPVMPHNEQQFRYEKGYLINVKSFRVFDVVDGKDVEGQKVVLNKRNNRVNQRWKIVYVDQFNE